MLVVSLICVNFGFWSHLRFSGKTPFYLAAKSRLELHAKKHVFFICLCFKMVSFRGQKKLGPYPDWSPLGV